MENSGFWSEVHEKNREMHLDGPSDELYTQTGLALNNIRKIKQAGLNRLTGGKGTDFKEFDVLCTVHHPTICI